MSSFVDAFAFWAHAAFLDSTTAGLARKVISIDATAHFVLTGGLSASATKVVAANSTLVAARKILAHVAVEGSSAAAYRDGSVAAA
jgi:hypothetical protein